MAVWRGIPHFARQPRRREPLARASDLSDEHLARTTFQLSEGLIGEIVAIVFAAAMTAAKSGAERITKSGIEVLRYVPVSNRRRAPVRYESLSAVSNIPTDR